MKTTSSLVLIILLILAGCREAAPLLLAEGAAGPFRKGMPMEEALSVAEQRYQVQQTTLSLEGFEYTVYDLVLDGELQLRLEPECSPECSLWRLWVHSPRYQTAEGIGPGSTLEEVLRHYTFSYFAAGKDIFLFVRETAMGFALDPASIPAGFNIHEAGPDKLPGHTQVAYIIP
jgi:hypothetical protein